jgi:predicted aminopeptidase
MKLILLLAAAVTAITGCATQGYLVKQGNWLLKTSGGTQSISSLLKAPDTPAATKEFLQRVAAIKRFAVERVGLKDNANYTRYKAIDRDHLVDVVQACDALSFTPYQWSYPFLGKLPYRGYYEAPDARAEAARLEKEGYDVIVRPVDAFSTLGFTKDPVYSFMEKYTPFALASTIIHEQTHATLFLKRQPEFNEELASFVGDTGAFDWLRETYGEDSPEYRAALDQEADSRQFIGLLRGLQQELETLYDGGLLPDEKLAEKKRLIAEFTAALASGSLGQFRTAGYRGHDRIRINNAYLSLYSLYSGDVPLLRAFWRQRCGSDLRQFMKAVRELSKKGDVKGQIRGELGE